MEPPSWTAALRWEASTLKDQYFGDRRDIFKYDLLTEIALSLPSGPTLTFVPMLTCPDGKKEGSLTAYDQDLSRDVIYSFLRDAVSTNGRRLARLRQLMPQLGVDLFLFRGDSEHDQYFEHPSRDDYFVAIPDRELSRSVLFLDPDVGLETGSVSYMRRNGLEKYLFYSELERLFHRASAKTILVVYQHLQNDKRRVRDDLRRRLRAVVQALHTSSATAVSDGEVAFLVTARDQVGEHAARVLSGYASRHSLAFEAAV